MAVDQGSLTSVLTPALPPPPPPSLTTRGNPLFSQVLQTLISRRRNDGSTDRYSQRNPAPPKRHGIPGDSQTLHRTSTHAGGVCRQELASNQRLREPVLATPLPCLQIEDHSSGGISADDNLALFRDKPGVSNYRQEAHTAVCHSETPEHLLGKYESSQLSDSHRLQFKHESLNPATSHDFTSLKQAVPASRTRRVPRKLDRCSSTGNHHNRDSHFKNCSADGNPAKGNPGTTVWKHTNREKTTTNRELDAAPSEPLQQCLHTLRHVGRMSAEELKVLAASLSNADEIAMTLLFSNCSTQLRDIQGKKACSKNSTEIEGVCLAFPVRGETETSPVLQYAFLPLDPANATVDNWCRSQLLRVLSNARVICYDGQELLSTIISHFEMEDSKAWLSWSALDTRIGGWLLDPDHPPDSFPRLLVRVGMQPAAGSVENDTSGILICKDLALVGPLMVSIYQRLQEKHLWSLFAELEVKLIPILAAMEVSGIHVNCEKLLHYAELLKAKISKVETSAHKAAGHPFSISSTTQLRQVLFDELHLDEKCSRKLSKTQVQRQKSTSEAVLTQLLGLHPLPALVLEYRQLHKMNTTYISGIMPYISSKGILKPCWQHTGAATGRLASCSPNIQAFPKQPINLGAVKEQYIVGKQAEEVRIDVREAVESRAGFSFLAADFKSIELRLLAHLSGDPALIRMLTSQQSSDVFTLLASEWLNLELEEVKPNDREKAKRVVYAVVYGVGKEKLAEILNVQPSYARDLVSSFLTKFPQVEVFIQKAIAECRNKECLVTICGRKRWFPHINSANLQLKSHCERQAVNFPIQGSAADICKSAMIKVSRMLATESPQSRLLLQIHDKLLFEVPNTEITTVAGKVKAVLESTSLLSTTLKVPLEVRVTSGKNWSALTPV